MKKCTAGTGRFGRTCRVFRGMSVRKRLFLLVGCALALMLACCFVLVNSMIGGHVAFVENSSAQLARRVVGNLDQSISALMDMSMRPLLEAEYTPSNIYNRLSYPDRFKSGLMSSEVRAFSMPAFAENKDIRLVVVFDLKGNRYSARSNRLGQFEVVSHVGDARESDAQMPWFARTLERRGAACLWRGDQVALPGLELPNPRDLLFISRTLNNIRTFQPIGVMLLALDTHSLTQDMRISLPFDQAQMALFDQSGARVAGAMDQALARALRARLEEGALHEGLGALRVDGTNYSVFAARGRYGHACLLAIPYGLILSSAGSGTWASLLLMALGCLILAALINAVVRSITQPIRALSDACGVIVRDKDFSARIEDAGRDEPAQLAASFNAMLEEIGHLVRDVYLKKVELTQMELQLLRSQLNPHFLYNTLDAMRHRALAAGQRDIHDSAMSLARLLRYLISAPNELVPARQEIAMLGEYLSLQSGIRPGRFDASIYVEPEVLDIPVPKCLLQPVVENALSHGLKLRESGGRIEVFGYREDRWVVFRVSDNGCGMTPKYLAAFADYLDNRNSDFQSIGLKNVHRRLKLIYGEACGILISSRAGEGTTITIRILPEEANAND